MNPELQNQYTVYKNTLQQLAQKIGDVEQEAEEHKYVFSLIHSPMHREAMIVISYAPRISAPHDPTAISRRIYFLDSLTALRSPLLWLTLCSIGWCWKPCSRCQGSARPSVSSTAS